MRLLAQFVGRRWTLWRAHSIFSMGYKADAVERAKDKTDAWHLELYYENEFALLPLS